MFFISEFFIGIKMKLFVSSYCILTVILTQVWIQIIYFDYTLKFCLISYTNYNSHKGESWTNCLRKEFFQVSADNGSTDENRKWKLLRSISPMDQTIECVHGKLFKFIQKDQCVCTFAKSKLCVANDCCFCVWFHNEQRDFWWFIA